LRLGFIELDLLDEDVAELVDGDHLPLLAAGNSNDNPNEPPNAQSDEADEEVEQVIHPVAPHHDRLEISLRLDPSTVRDLPLQSVCQ
jgi:hypothetical protein